MRTEPISAQPQPGVFTPTAFRGLPAFMGRSPFCTVTVLPTWGAKIASLRVALAQPLLALATAQRRHLVRARGGHGRLG